MNKKVLASWTNPPAVQVERQQLAAIFGWPVVPQIDARAAMCMTAAELVARGVPFGRSPAAAVVVVKMVGVRVDRVIDAAVGSDGGAAGVMRAGDQMK